MLYLCCCVYLWKYKEQKKNSTNRTHTSDMLSCEHNLDKHNIYKHNVSLKVYSKIFLHHNFSYAIMHIKNNNEKKFHLHILHNIKWWFNVKHHFTHHYYNEWQLMEFSFFFILFFHICNHSVSLVMFFVVYCPQNRIHG